MAQPDPNTAVALEAIAEGLDILHLLACATDNIGWLNDSIPLSKLSELAQSLGYRDAQSVHSQVEHDRDLDECHAKIRQLRTRLMMLDSVEATLADCGTSGSYAEFDTPADAIVQMDDRIKELDALLIDERRLRQEAERHVKESDDYLRWLHRILREGGYILSTNEDGVPVLAHNPLRKLEREKAEAEQRTERAEAERDEISENLKRMVELNEWSRNELGRTNQRAERAEALAQLVTPELPALLEKLA